MRQNPFVIEQALLSRVLIVRQEELRQVKEALAQGRKLFLHVWLQKLSRSLFHTRVIQEWPGLLNQSVLKSGCEG